MADRGRAKRDLRQAVGRALRGVRERGSFSLDDLARASKAEGVNVSRSHLSRVENGEADLSLPRFLVLMRALGEPRDTVLHDLDARLAAGGASLETLLDEARAARTGHEHERVSERLAAAFVIDAEALIESDLAAWIRAEAALGRWRSAARIAQLRLSRRGLACEGEALVEAATALLGAGQERAALAFARAGLPHREGPARVAEAAALLALELPELALERLDALGGPRRAPEVSALALAVAASAYLALNKERAALHAIKSALEMRIGELARAEVRLTMARVEGALRRPRAGLRALSKVLPLARSRRLFELSARAQRRVAALHRQSGGMDEARAATRAMRALARRAGSDRGQAPALPLQALLRLANQAEESSPSAR